MTSKAKSGSNIGAGMSAGGAFLYLLWFGERQLGHRRSAGAEPAEGEAHRHHRHRARRRAGAGEGRRVELVSADGQQIHPQLLWGRRHIVTTAIEHAAVLEPVKALERQGYEVTYLKPDRRGNIDPAQAAAALSPPSWPPAPPGRPRAAPAWWRRYPNSGTWRPPPEIAVSIGYFMPFPGESQSLFARLSHCRTARPRRRWRP